VLALNKIDLINREQLLPLIDWFRHLHPFAAIVPISALQGDGADVLLEELVSRLPQGPQYYPPDIPTDATERFLAAELIREQIFLRVRQEIPYSTAVLVESFKENQQRGTVTVHAAILVERDSQKGIILGKKGTMLGQIRTAATKEIEKLLACKVTLQLFVKVRKNWTEDEQILSELGL
jgi:GTP-binding protein Era